MVEAFILFGPIAATILAAFLLFAGLERDLEDKWLPNGMGIFILLIVPFWLFYVSTSGGLGTAFAFFFSIICSVITITMSAGILWDQKGRWKIIGLIIGVLFPVASFTGVWFGETQSRENRTEQNGNQIVSALNQYYEDKAQFPKTLSLLEPDYLATQPEALTTQQTGWLYESGGDSFTLGYWYYPEKFGSIVCLYISTNDFWDCEFNGWGPFGMVSTPGP